MDEIRTLKKSQSEIKNNEENRQINEDYFKNPEEKNPQSKKDKLEELKEDYITERSSRYVKTPTERDASIKGKSINLEDKQ